jgi:phage host-nuclease inhibitor protein Gam
MGRPRRKADAIIAPQTIEEATALIVLYAEIHTKVDQIDLDAAQAITQIQGARDALKMPLIQDAEGIFMRLRAWWAVAGPEIVAKNRKSAKIAGSEIGERKTPRKLKLKKGFTVDQAIEWLTTNGHRNLLRTKRSLDKPAILSAVKADDVISRSLQGAGFGTSQKTEFFIDRDIAEAKPADVEIMPADQVPV